MRGGHRGPPLHRLRTVGATPVVAPQFVVMGTNKHRRSIRLKDYDYAQVGAYFVTIVVQDRKCLVGEIIGGVMQLNAAGLMAQAVWEDLPNYYAGIDPDSFVVMPNHPGDCCLGRGTGAPP